MPRTTTISTLVLLLATACANEGESGSDPDAVDDVQVAASTRNDLQWKRAWALGNDLAQALALAPEELCKEMGQYDCIRQVHLVSLGGHDAIETAIYESLPAPLATSPVAVDRVVLSACTARVDLDTAGTPVVFTELDLGGDAPSADSEQVDATIVSLYRRLLARDPIEAEVKALSTLVVDDDGNAVTATEFAKLACYAIGTSTEFLFI